MPDGVVQWFSDRKGYGFIVAADGREVFVDHRAIVADGFRTLHAGQAVTFEDGDDGRGPVALQVRDAGEGR